MMANSILDQMISGNQQMAPQNNNIMNIMMGLMNSGGSPLQAIMNMAQQNNNPILQLISQALSNSNGMTDEEVAKQAFYNLAQQRGINPEPIINQIKQLQQNYNF